MDLEREEKDKNLVFSRDKVDDITFSEVCFQYGTRVEVFKNLNLTIQKGSITAFVGESGSGKSTLVSLIQNIYPINKGKIRIGDIDINHIENHSLRNLISVVPQKIDLFAGNVIENIAVGELQPDFEKIHKICKDIGILDFIESLPNDFSTYLGENGASLSGGQKQRIAIARALYKDPEILVLDEATSSLDSNSENYVQKTIDNLRSEGKTVIIIAHRLSTVINADKIVVLDKGKVLEEGSHYQLYDQKGAYFKLWQQQVPSFLSILKPVN